MKITQNVTIGTKQSKLGEYTRREPPHLPPRDVDVQALERDLAANIKGEVRFDGGRRGLYAADHSIYRQTPMGVVIPKDTSVSAASWLAGLRWSSEERTSCGCGRLR